VVLDSRSGGVANRRRRDYRRSHQTGHQHALRQAGSHLQLFTYLAALPDKPRSPASGIRCDALDLARSDIHQFCRGQPAACARPFRGHAANTAAFNGLAQRWGLGKGDRWPKTWAIRTPLEAVPGLALRQSEVRLIEL